MSIIVTCTGCGRKLRLAEQHAGKTARCPMCRMTFPVPVDAPSDNSGGEDVLHIGPDGSSGATPNSATPKFSSSAPTYSSASADSWFLRVPEGHQYGPVPKAEMDAWVKEGRVTAQCQLKNGESSPWQPAGSVYSFLGSAPAAPMQQPTQPANPFAQPLGGAPYNPYAAPMAPGMAYPPGGYGYRKPHRGGLILALGIIGFFFWCPLLPIVNLVMAFSDLTEMDRGQMDSSGQGLTRVGQVLSILSLVAVGGFVLLMLMVGAMDM